MELDEQLYLITGILSGTILLLLVFVIVLAIQLKKEKAERMNNEARFLTMADPSIHRGEELQRRGYGMYQGQAPPKDHHAPPHHHPAAPSHHGDHHHHAPHHHGDHPHHPAHHNKHNKPNNHEHGSIPSLHSSLYHNMQQINPPPLQHGGIRSSKNYKH